MTVYAVLPEATGFSPATPAAVSMSGVYLFTAYWGRAALPQYALVSPAALPPCQPANQDSRPPRLRCRIAEIRTIAGREGLSALAYPPLPVSRALRYSE